MPLLTMRTNISLDNARRADLVKQASAKVSSLLSKPEQYVMVHVQDTQAMLFAGKDDPCALLELKSIGLPEDRTAGLSSALCELITAETGIAADRIYIEFTNAERHMWGWNSGTF